MDLFGKSHPTSVLGLSMEGSRFEAVVVKRTNGSAQVTESRQIALTLDPLNAEPELAGRELRNQLDAAEIRERRCVVCLPLNWALTLQTKLPPLPEADVASFLEIEAERGFPYGLETLFIASSTARLEPGEVFVTQVAVQRDHVIRLERVLRAARLIPVSFSLGLPSLLSGAQASGAADLALLPGETGLGLGMTGGGGLVLLRTLDNALEVEGSERRFLADVIARELRITLGHLPLALREAARKVRVFGSGETGGRLALDLRPRAEAIGLKVERASVFAPGELGLKIHPENAPAAPALALAARFLGKVAPELEFLPPKVSFWQKVTAKYSSKKLVWAGAAAGLLVALIAGGFLLQQIQLNRLNKKWTAISPKVEELEQFQGKIRQFRPWFDEGFRNLSILRRVTEAFPEDGAVTARTIELHDAAPVACSGTAKDNKALMEVIDRLRGMPEISEVQTGQLRGKAPVQFSMNFVWGERSQP